jgi:opacity protein-like surface antigen
MTGWLAAIVAAAACAVASTTAAVHGAQQVTQQQAQPAQSQPAQSQAPAQPAQTQAPTRPAGSQSPAQQAAGPGYLGNVAGGGTQNPCNYASGYQLGVCNPTGQTEQEYIADPGGVAPGTPTNSQGCYYVRMDTGYCPSTGQDIPMKDPNDPGN